MEKFSNSLEISLAAFDILGTVWRVLKSDKDGQQGQSHGATKDICLYRSSSVPPSLNSHAAAFLPQSANFICLFTNYDLCINIKTTL
jgi:hypothetical protein